MRKRFVIAGIVGSLCLLATLLFGADFARGSTAVPGETDPLRSRVKELEARVKALEETVKELKAMLEPGVSLPDTGASAPPPTFRRVPQAPLRRGQVWREGECNGWPYYRIPCGAVEAGAVR